VEVGLGEDDSEDEDLVVEVAAREEDEHETKKIPVWGFF
jgi:hypothetical protein